ncbi:MAG: hypothetical protein K8R59_02530 [Thermoanaerobaculales bacterium]|nr:hypothetical protein [Thermoanaerobaculales bacterium]
MNAKGFLLLLLLSTFLVPLLSCGRLNRWGRLKQIDSFSRVAAIAKTLDSRCANSGGPLSEGEISTIVKSIGSGLDAWGHDIRILNPSNDQGAGYIVVSPGRDGEFDFTNTDRYFTLPRVDIRGLLDRDIVYRDGRCVTNAGKDPDTDFPAAEPSAGIRSDTSDTS